VSQENVEVVRRLFDAFNGGGIDRVIGLVHPEFSAEIPPEISAEPDTYRGHAGIRRYFESFEDVMTDIRFQPERFWDAGDSVVVAILLSARGKQTGIEVEQRSAGVWTIRDGKVIGSRTYLSLSDALAAVGLSDEASAQAPWP
jgi:ketosteroid isomerase-like protein